MQCPSCGRRFRGGRCPTHGAPISLGVAPVPEKWPAFPGYTVDGVLGHGGFGTVYRAQGPEGAVAIKAAHRSQPVADARLRREAEALAAIGPPHVPRLHTKGDLDDGTCYVVMDLITWPTLADRLADRGPLRVDEVVPIARGILTALGAAHAKGLVHRDLKPENIFVADDGAAQLVDFGLVKRVGAAPAEGLTVTGMIVGSSAYMSPEQSMGRDDVDARSDIYAIGVILYEMIAGRPPFLGAAADVLQAHIARRPPRLATLAPIPASVDDLVHRCLSKGRDDRPDTPGDVLHALETARRDAPSAPSVVRASIPGRSAAPAAGGVPSREKRMVGLLTFRAPVDAPSVQALATSFAGHLARADGSFAVVFDHDAGDNPAKRALVAAQAVLSRGLTETAMVDTVAVTVMPRPDGSRRYVSPAFSREDSFPVEGDPTGILATPKAAEVFGDLGKHPAGRGLLLLTESGVEHARHEAQALIGREATLAAIREAAGEAATGRPTIVTVAGAPGVGKSHLLQAALQGLRELLPDAEVMELRAREPVGGEAGGSLRDLTRLALDLPAARPDDGGRSLLAERLGIMLAEELWPGVAVALGWAGAVDTEVRARAAAPGVLRATAARAIGVALRQRALDRPLILALDDAHLADPASLDGLELAALEEGAARLAVVVTMRPVLLEGRPGWGDRAARHRKLELGPLDEVAAGEMLRRHLEPAENVPVPVVERLVARTQGVPLLLAELARGLKREGLIRRHAKGEGWYLASEALEALPDLPLVEWLANRELAWMSPELGHHARLLALLGGEATAPEVRGVLAELDRAGLGEQFPLDADVALARLVEGGLAVERGGRLAFRSGIVREAVQRATPPAMAGPIHEAAHEFYRASGDPAWLPALAYHAGRCGRPRDAFDAYMQVARRSHAQHAYVDAEVFYGRALENKGHGEPAEALFEALHGRGLMRYRLARYDDALEFLRQARDLAAERGDRAGELTITLDEASVMDWLDDYHESRDLVEKARALADEMPGGPGPLLQAQIAMGLGRSATRFSDYEPAGRLLLDAAARAEGLGDAGYETFVISLLLGGYVLTLLDRFDESRAAFGRVIPLVAARGDKLHLGAALANRNVLWIARNELDRAVADLQQVLDIAREIGNPRMECGARQMLACSLHWLGRSAEAELHARRAIEVDDRRHGSSARVESRLYLARILAVRGDLDAARVVLDEIHARHQAALDRGSRDAELIPVEEVTLSLVELLVGGGPASSWSALEEKARTCLTGPDLDEVVRLARAHAAT